MHWIYKLIAAIVVWAIASLVVAFIGGLLLTVNQAQISYLGAFLKAGATVIGFLIAASYFLWGPPLPLPPR